MTRRLTMLYGGLGLLLALMALAAPASPVTAFQAPMNQTAGPFSQVSAGLAHTCAIRTDGTIACWGNNAVGQAPASRDGWTIRARQRRSGPHLRDTDRRHDRLLG